MLGLSGFGLILVFSGILAIAVTAFAHAMRYSVFVKPKVEWVVISSINGGIKALGPGTHALSPGWAEVGRIPTNIQENSEEGEEVRTKDSIRLAITERLNYVAGHAMVPIAPINAGWWDFATPDRVDPDMVVLASTSIDPGKRTELSSIYEQIRLAVDAACEEVFGLYTAVQLLSPSTARQKPIIPNKVIPGLGLAPKAVDNVPEVLQRLAAVIRMRANRTLHLVGVGLSDLIFTNIRYFDLDLQTTAEKGRKGVMLAENAKKTLAALPADHDLTVREALAIGGPDYQALAVAQAGLLAAKLTANAKVDAAKAKAGGTIGGAKELAKGMSALARAAQNITIKHTK